MRRSNFVRSHFAEPLERRMLLTGFSQNVGALSGRFYRQGQAFGSDTDVYTFTMPRGGNINVQLSRLSGTTGNMVLKHGSTVVAQSSESSSDQQLSFFPLDLSGSFTLSVRADQHQLAPAIFYTLAIVTDFAPQLSDTQLLTESALGPGVLSEESNNRQRDFIGFFDTSDHAGKDVLDMYRIDAPAAGSIDIFLSLDSLQDPAGSGAKVGADMRLFRDTNQDGTLESNELLADVNTGNSNIAEVHPTFTHPVTLFVVVGTLGIPVNGNTGGSNYHIDFDYHASDFAGNTLGAAKSVTLGGSTSTFNDYLSSVDTNDFYKFTVPGSGGPYQLDATMSGFPDSDFDLQLIQDKNGDGTIEALNGEIISASQSRTPGTAEHIGKLVTVPGRYFLRATRFVGEDTYTIKASLKSTDTAQSTFLTSGKNLGTLSTSITTSEFVGAIDSADIFRVHVNSAGEMRVNFTSPASGVPVTDVIRDANNNGVIDAGENLGTLNGGNVLDGVVLPVAGDYFIRVRPNAGADANYSMTLTFSRQTPFSGSPIHISSAGITRIEAENFDAGPDPDAYHDTDATNSGGSTAFRADTGVDTKPTNDTGGGFRVTDTAVGEFLEYTIVVDAAGNYDINFRVSGNGDGARVHAEIDGTPVTNKLSVPNRNSFDSMVDLVAPNIALKAGPHVLRLAFDAGATNGLKPGFAGSYNFISLSPTGSPGVFTIGPKHRTVRAGQDAPLAVTWTVPSGSWRQLKTIDLRLVDEQGDTVARLRWDEASNTIALFNPKKGKFGAAKLIGGNATLSNKFVKLRLKNSTVHAAGPASPTVTVTFDLTFTKHLRGRRLSIQAAATDDVGRHRSFEGGGTINVTDPRHDRHQRDK